MVEKNEKLEHDKNKETQENTPDVSDDGKKKEHDKDNATEKTEIKLADLEEEIDKMMVASDSKSDKKKLEKIKEEIQEKANDQQFLSKKAKEVQEMKKETTDAEYNPSLLKRLWYGTLLGGIGSSFGGNVGKQIKEWSEKKLKEKPKHAEKKSFMGKVADALLVSSAVLFAKKLFGKGVDLFSHKDEKKENTPQQPEVAPEKKDDNTPEKNITQIPEQPALADPSSVGVEAAHEEQEPELQPHEAAAIEQAKEEEKKMQEEGVSSLYILSRMIAMGYVPSKLYGWRLPNKILEKPWNMKVGLMKLIPSMREHLIREKSYLLANGINAYDYDTHLNRLEAMHEDIKSGKITTLDQLKKSYPDMVDAKPRAIEKLLRNKDKPLKRASQQVDQKLDVMKTKEQELKSLDEQMKSLEGEAKKKYAALEQLDKEAQKDPAKKKQLISELDAITKEYNGKSAQVSAEIGHHLQGLSDAEIVRYQRQFQSADILIKSNGGPAKFLEKTNAKFGKSMMRIAVAGLAWRSITDVAEQGIISKETALDVADMGIGFIPVAGGLYDMGMAINGKDLNGRDLSTTDRWIRGTVGLGSAILDVFTFGVGGTAVRAGVKATEATVKVVEGAVKTERAASKGAKIGEQIYQGTKLVTHGTMFAGLCYGVYANVYDITVVVSDIGRPVVHTIEENNVPNRTIE